MSFVYWAAVNWKHWWSSAHQPQNLKQSPTQKIHNQNYDVMFPWIGFTSFHFRRIHCDNLHTTHRSEQFYTVKPPYESQVMKSLWDIDIVKLLVRKTCHARQLSFWEWSDRGSTYCRCPAELLIFHLDLPSSAYAWIYPIGGLNIIKSLFLSRLREILKGSSYTHHILAAKVTKIFLFNQCVVKAELQLSSGLPVSSLRVLLESLKPALVPSWQGVEGLDKGVLQLWVRAVWMQNLFRNIFYVHQIIWSVSEIFLQRTIWFLRDLKLKV